MESGNAKDGRALIIPISVTIIAVVSLVWAVWAIRGRESSRGSPDGLANQLRPIDVKAFRNLIDEDERQYLRRHLSRVDFRRIHRERMLAAAEYVWWASKNAGILIRLGEASAHDPDPAVAAAAASLQENAMQLRLHSMQTLPKLYLSIFFPSISWTPQQLPEGFDRLNRQAVILGCLQVQGE